MPNVEAWVFLSDLISRWVFWAHNMYAYICYESPIIDKMLVDLRLYWAFALMSEQSRTIFSRDSGVKNVLATGGRVVFVEVREK